LESQNATLLEVADRRDSDRESRADELAGRLHELEARILEASRLGSEVELIAERVDAVEQSAPDEALREEVSELRRLVEKQHSASPALDSRWNELRERLELVSERLSEVESASRPEDLSERFQALEERLSALDQLSGFAGRLAALETAPGNGSERVDELLQRVLALESGGAAGVGEAVAELQSELAALRERLPTAATGGADWSALDERLRELENRADSPLLDNSVMPAALAQQLGEIEDRLAARNHGEHESDPRTTELMGRMSVLEQEYRLSGGRDDLEAVWERLDVLDGALKQAAEGGEDSQRQLERWEALEQRLAEIEQRESQAEGDGSSAEEALALVRSEAERWTSWARTTMEDMGRLRAQVEQLESAKGGSSEDDVSVTRAESIAAAVAAGLNKGEVKGLRTQMYFVFFAIGILWVLTLVMLLMR
jgi:predicted  nucleic acid-binding Zn-ribbon protein